MKGDHQSPLRARMIEDMTLAGLAEGTQKIYIQAVRRLATHYRRSSDELGEEEVRGYLLELRQRGVARGTFKTGQYGPAFPLPSYRSAEPGDLCGERKHRLATAEAAA
jgi:Phage integrase, N-terminal SAM-like domain